MSETCEVATLLYHVYCPIIVQQLVRQYEIKIFIIFYQTIQLIFILIMNIGTKSILWNYLLGNQLNHLSLNALIGNPTGIFARFSSNCCVLLY